MKPGFWVSWRHLGSLKKARFATAEERAVFVQTWLRDGKPALWETNSRGQRICQKIERKPCKDFPRHRPSHGGAMGGELEKEVL